MLAVAALLLAGSILTWHDDFDDPDLDPAWSTRAPDYVTNQCGPRCVRVRDGQLILSTRTDPAGDLVGGMVRTEGLRNFAPYGYFEARVRFPAVRGTLASWWLQSVDEYASPAETEVDVAENGGTPRVHHVVWWRDPGQNAGEFHTPAPHLVTDLGSRDAQHDWHTYGVRWRPDGYRFYVDGDPVGTISEGLSDTPKYLVLSIRAPGFAAEHLDPTHLYQMRVDWVRVWQ